MIRKILLIEDSDHKRVRVLSFLRENFSGLLISEANSFNGGCKAVEREEYDIVLMDMSLPTYDRSATDSGGKFRALGGREIARKIIRRKKCTKIVFLTQYDSFSDEIHSLNLRMLDSELKRECGDNYAGLIYYDSSKSSWKDELGRILGGA